jgi:CDP-diacylglycerol--glycerol-3-phosphate 3-phosphatidyltransferase
MALQDIARQHVLEKPEHADMFTIPNLLSLLRLVLTPVLLVLAWQGQEQLFLWVIACSLVSDVLDGLLARLLNQHTVLGVHLDSWADLSVYLATPLCVWWLWPEVVRQEAAWVLLVVVGYVLPIPFGLLKYRRLTAYHTWAAKGVAWLLCIGALVLVLDGPSWPFRVAALTLAASALEEIALTLLLPTWTPNIPSLWHERYARPTRQPLVETELP